MIQVPKEPNPAEPLSSLWGALVSRCLRASRPMPSEDILPVEGMGGTKYILTKKAKMALAAVVSHPFQVVVGPMTSNDGMGDPQIGVISDSHVMNSVDKNTNELDNSDWGDEGAGLLTDDMPDDDPGWFVVPKIGSKIYLRFEFDAMGTVLSVDLEYGAVGTDGNWPRFPDPIEIIPNGYQQYYYMLIAEVTDPEEDPRDGLQLTLSDGTAVQVTQMWKTNAMLTTANATWNADQPGLFLIVAIPWIGPATASDGSADPINSDDDIMTPWQFGTAPGLTGFQLVNASDKDGTKVRVVAGSLIGALPDGFTEGDDPPFILNASDGDQVYACVSYDTTDGVLGNVSSRSIGIGQGVPEDDNENATFYYLIGSIAIVDGIVVPTNYAYSPLNATPFRNWFTFDPVTYGIEWNVMPAYN
jgi:hypothetical protein